VLINSGKSVRSALTADDVIAIDMDGKPVDGDVVPPMEFHIHTEIYRRRPDVNAVAHTHPVWSTLFSMTGQKVEPVTMQAAVMGPIQLFGKTASINQKALAEELAAALGPHRVVMLKSHGAVVVGADIVEAFVLAIYLEETARRQYLARTLGTPYALSPAEVETIGANLRKPHLLKKVWDYHHAKLRAAQPEK
jgi:L-fuculose-phosphate aldolase